MKRALAFLLLLLVASPLLAVNKFVWSGTAGSGCTLGECWENAYTSMGRDWGAETNFTLGTDVVYVHQGHAESSASTITITGSTVGTDAPIAVLCVVGATTGTTPGNPCTSADLATVTTTAANSDVTIREGIYIRGVQFFSGDDINLAELTGAAKIKLSLCRLELTGTSGADQILVSVNGNATNLITLENVDVDFGNVGQGFQIMNNSFRWYGGTLDANVNFLFELLNTRAVYLEARGLDLSILTGSLFQAAQVNALHAVLSDLKLNASTTFIDSNLSTPESSIEASYSVSGTSANPTLQHAYYNMSGSMVADTARHMGNSTDGTTDYSWSLDTSYGVTTSRYEPFRSPPVSFWMDGDGSTTQTIRFYVANSAQLDNSQFWVTCQVPTAADTSSLADLITSEATPPTAGSNLTADGSTWTCSSDCDTPMRVDLTAVPDKPGLATCWFFLSADGARVSVDPTPTLNP